MSLSEALGNVRSRLSRRSAPPTPVQELPPEPIETRAALQTDGLVSAVHSFFRTEYGTTLSTPSRGGEGRVGAVLTEDQSQIFLTVHADQSITVDPRRLVITVLENGEESTTLISSMRPIKDYAEAISDDGTKVRFERLVIDSSGKAAVEVIDVTRETEEGKGSEGIDRTTRKPTQEEIDALLGVITSGQTIPLKQNAIEWAREHYTGLTLEKALADYLK